MADPAMNEYRNYRTNYKGEVFFFGSFLLGLMIYVPLAVFVFGSMFGAFGVICGLALGLWGAVRGAYGKPPEKYRRNHSQDKDPQ